jgi:hypothetical protein
VIFLEVMTRPNCCSHKEHIESVVILSRNLEAVPVLIERFFAIKEPFPMRNLSKFQNLNSKFCCQVLYTSKIIQLLDQMRSNFDGEKWTIGRKISDIRYKNTREVVLT